MADLGCHPLDRSPNQGDGLQPVGMAVPRRDLGRCRLDGETELLTDVGFDFRWHLGICADRT